MAVAFSVGKVIGHFSRHYYSKTMVLNLEQFAFPSSGSWDIWPGLETHLAFTAQDGDVLWACRRQRPGRLLNIL